MKLKHFVTNGRFPDCKIVNVNQFSLLSLGKDCKNIFNCGDTDFQQLKNCTESLHFTQDRLKWYYSTSLLLKI